MIDTTINGKWRLKLPPHRAKLEQWKSWERVRLDSMHDNLKEGDVLYDIGAEECDLSGLFASWGAKLVLVEPTARIWANAKAIWDANALDAPLGFFTGFACDEDEDREATQGFSKGWPASADGPIVTDHGFSVVHERPDLPRVRIDTLVEMVGRVPTALTLDVEGAELLVLRGAEQTLRTHRPLVWVSVHPTFMADTYRQRATDLWEFFSSVGYTWQLLDYDHELHVIAWHYYDGRRPSLPWD